MTKVGTEGLKDLEGRGVADTDEDLALARALRTSWGGNPFEMNLRDKQSLCLIKSKLDVQFLFIL